MLLLPDDGTVDFIGRSSFSPDGRYLAFASDRSGNYDIYIYEFMTGQTWQLTDTEEEDYPGGWAN